MSLTTQAQVTKTVHVTTPGTLGTLLGSDLKTVTDLTITGTINATDFNSIKSLSALKNLDMEEVVIDNGKIPDGTFKGRVMERIILPESLVEIGNDVFNGMTISKLNISDCINLNKIGRRAFDNIRMTDLTLDFSRCSKLVSFYTGWYNDNTGCFPGFKGHIILPDNLKILPNNVFRNYKGSVDLPKGLGTIENSAFASSNMSHSLIIPSSVNYINNSAFLNASLNNFASLNPTPPSLGSNVFQGVNKATCTLYVPKGSVPLYAVADQWKDFLNIQEYSVFLTDNLQLNKSADSTIYKVKPQNLSMLRSMLIYWQT